MPYFRQPQTPGRLQLGCEAGLTHSNLVDVYDIVRDADTLFLVMELLEGDPEQSVLMERPHPRRRLLRVR